MIVSLIVAVARNGVIGRDGDLPWRLPRDLAYFKERTMGHHVIMGRRTWESIGRPLPGRSFVVVSRRQGFEAPGCRVVSSLSAALELAREAGEDEAFVIGGAALYAEALGRADRIYLTEVQADVDGDVTFPALGEGWREVAREGHPADERHAYAVAFVVLERA